MLIKAGARIAQIALSLVTKFAASNFKFNSRDSTFLPEGVAALMYTSRLAAPWFL